MLNLNRLHSQLGIYFISTMKQKTSERQQQQEVQQQQMEEYNNNRWRSRTTKTMGRESATYGKKNNGRKKYRSVHNFECFAEGQQHYATFLSTHTYRERERQRKSTFWTPFGTLSSPLGDRQLDRTLIMIIIMQWRWGRSSTQNISVSEHPLSCPYSTSVSLSLFLYLSLFLWSKPTTTIKMLLSDQIYAMCESS